QFTPEEQAFREEVRTWLRANLPAHIREQVIRAPSYCEQVGHEALEQDAGRQGVDRAELAEGIWRDRLDPYAEIHLRRGISGRPLPAPVLLRPHHGRPGHLHLRHAGAEEAASAVHPD